MSNKMQKPDEVQLINFQVRESYKTARTNIVYSILKQGCKKITFTSAMKGEGKTVTSTNIAHALAQQVNTKVLLLTATYEHQRFTLYFILTLHPVLPTT